MDLDETAVNVIFYDLDPRISFVRRSMDTHSDIRTPLIIRHFNARRTPQISDDVAFDCFTLKRAR